MQSSDAAEQVVKFTLDGVQTIAHISGKGALELAKLLISEARKSEATKGKSSLAKMIKSKEPIKVFEISDKDLKSFCKMAKKYGISYHIMKDKRALNDKCDIMTYARDAAMVGRVLKRLGLATENKANIRQTIVRSKDDRVSVRDELTSKSGKKKVSDRFIDELFREPDETQFAPLRPRAGDKVSEISSRTKFARPVRPKYSKPSVLQQLQDYRVTEKTKGKQKTKSKTKKKSKGRSK